MSVATPGRLIGRRVLVTGGGSGIGRATAARLVADGASVAILDVRQHLVDEVEQSLAPQLVDGAALAAIVCDVSSEDDVIEATRRSVEVLGGLDGVVAAAGVASAGMIHELTLHDWNLVIGINLTGTFLTVKHALPHLMEAERSAVVTIGSIASQVIGAGGSAASYPASKGGVLQFTKAVAVGYAPHGVRALCVCPGAVATNIGRHARELAEQTTTAVGAFARFEVPVPDNRAADPSEVGDVCAFLLSEDASFMTGSAVMVDGGYTAL